MVRACVANSIWLIQFMIRKMNYNAIGLLIIFQTWLIRLMISFVSISIRSPVNEHYRCSFFDWVHQYVGKLALWRVCIPENE